mmetsp:Transcript_31451/g.45874  ORF Transcript_31451/g.45874 Transcript_31451/m.45874 type:complete len:120 (-) Transcript_31451:2032-2391(-)
MPKKLSKDAATHAALDLIDAIKENTHAAPFMNTGNRERATLTKLADIFHDALNEDKTLTITPTPPPPAPHPIYMPRMPTMAPTPMVPPMQYAPQMQYMLTGPLLRVPQTQANMCMPHTA